MAVNVGSTVNATSFLEGQFRNYNEITSISIPWGLFCKNFSIIIGMPISEDIVYLKSALLSNTTMLSF